MFVLLQEGDVGMISADHLRLVVLADRVWAFCFAAGLPAPLP
jgi:hypothetical protein